MEMVVEAMAEAVIEVEKAAKVAVAKAGAVRAKATVLMVKAVVAKTGSARASVARVMEMVATVVGSLAPLKPASPSVTVHLWSR